MKHLLLFLIPVLLFSFSSDSNNKLFLKVDRKKGYYYFANAKGKKVIKEKYTSASIFSEGLAVVSTDLKYGVINSNGDWVIPAKYYDIGDFHEGLAWYKKSAKAPYGFMDTKGNVVIKPQYAYVEDFVNGFAIIGMKNDEKDRLGKGDYKYFVINKRGEFLLDSAFTLIHFYGDSLFQCYVNKDYYTIDSSGKLLSTHSDVDSNDLKVDVKPEFPKGDKARINFLIRNIYYPEIAKAHDIQGTVYVSFVVEKNGVISHVKVLKSPHPVLSKEAIRVVREFPKWKPGKQNGKKVGVYFSMPLRFILGD